MSIKTVKITVKSHRPIKKRLRDNIAGYLFIAPALFGFLAFMLYPMIASIVISFYDWNILNPPKFIGIGNYINLFHDQVFLISLKNTLLWVVYYVPASIVLSFVLALLMNLPLRGIAIYRSIYYIPVISPLLSVALLFVWLYNPDFGLINYVLSKLGIAPLGWLTDSKLALPSIAIMAIWKNAGWNMLIFLAGLQGIPRQLYEAAELDGITPFQKIWYITLPLLTPATFFIVVTAIIGAFQVFGEVYIMTSGGPGYSTYTLAYYLWSNAFQYNKMGYASAIAMVMFILIFVVTALQDRLFGRRVQYDM